MKKHIRQMAFAIIFFSLFQNLFAAEPLLIKVGAFNNYPVLFMDKNGAASGFYVDLLTEIGKKENIRFEYVFGSWADGLENIKNGKVNLLTSVAYTEERSKFMDFCRSPLLTVWGELYSLKSSNINSMFDISGRKIGLMKGDVNARDFKVLTGKFGIKYETVEFAGFEDIFKAVFSGVIDAGVVGVTFGASKAMEYGLRSTGVVFNPVDLFFATEKGKNLQLILILDGYLDEWKRHEHSVYNISKKKWLHGYVGAVPVMPEWLFRAMFILGVIFIAAAIFIVLLHAQVKKATKEIVEREKKLRESEEIFNQFMQQCPIYVFFKDSEIRALRLSANFEKMIGKPMNEIIGRKMEELFPPEFAQKMIEDDVRIIKEGKVSSFDEEFGGRCYSTIKFPFKAGGVKQYLAGFTIDITERKLAEDKVKVLLEEKELLLKEVHHRIKNNMNTIKGLLTLQLSAEENPQVTESLRDAESRVQSMIMLYDKLYCNENYRELSVKEYLQSLAEEIVGTFPNSGVVKIETAIDDFVLNVNILSPLGIIVNELLTNMMKYAFTGKESGVIFISASLENNHAVIIIQDNGVGIPDSVSFKHTTGFGLDLVGMLTEQIGGNIKIERGAGTRFILEFDL